MTTIAYKDGVLAADTRSSIGDSLLGDLVKIVRRPDGHLAGAAGSAAYLSAFHRWFLAGENGDPPHAGEAKDWLDRGIIIIFRPNGDVEVFEPEGSHLTHAPYFAIGSGRPEALGAMFAGGDAVTAVRAAIEHDAHTAGDIVVLSHKRGAKVMKKSMDTGVSPRKATAMGMYAGKGNKGGGKGKPKPPAPKGGRKGY